MSPSSADQKSADRQRAQEAERRQSQARKVLAGKAPSDFIRTIVAEDVLADKHKGRVATRFPPEPNGYLHIGHAKSMCLNFGVAREYLGTCNLRYDDTNPETEDMEYVRSIQEDVRWLGFDWEDRCYFASDYFERLYAYAEELITKGLAYVDSSSEEEIRRARGTVRQPGEESPYRSRSVEENLDLFRRMRAGEFPDGAHVLRAKIDMAAPNMKMRDPLLYRIRKAEHYRRGDSWSIYPMYDFAHCLSDAEEGITHSLCTLEFENNRELYDWIVANVSTPSTPRQIEFARLNLSHTVLSKRKLLKLVKEGRVAGWDDPRMPTLSGLRRRGTPPEAIRDFAERVGVAKTNSTVDMALLEHCVRDDLNPRVPRVLCVLDPLPVVIENYPEGQVEELEAPYYPHDVPKEGSRSLPFSRRLLIERDDFMEEPAKGFYRLAPGREVRLRYAYLIRCTGVVKDEATGEIKELRCTYDPATRGGSAPDGRKVKATLHWVSAEQSLPVEVRLYDRLFKVERPDLAPEGTAVESLLNPGSLVTLREARIEPSAAGAGAYERYQFERQGYFAVDPVDSGAGALVFNRIVPLKDTWAKLSRAGAEAEGDEPLEDDAGGRRQPARAEAEAGEGAQAASSRPKPRPTPQPLTPEQETRLARYRDELGLPEQDAWILAERREVADLFEAALGAHANPRGLANWIVNELLRELKDRPLEELPFGAAELAELVALMDDGTLSSKLAKEVFAEMLTGGGRPRRIVADRGLEQVDDAGVLEPLVEGVLAAHPDEVAAYRGGKAQLLGFFVGQVMRESRGKAKPELVNELLRRRLGGG